MTSTTLRNVLIACVALVIASAGQQAVSKKPAAAVNPAATSAKPSVAGAASGHVPSNEEVNSFLHHMFGYDPNLKFEVVRVQPSEATGVSEALVSVQTSQGQQRLNLFITPDGQHAINGEMVPFGADPFAKARNLLAAAKGPSRGPANAALVIVDFSDLQCPHCKRAVPVVDKLLADNPNARLVFENFPLPSHDWAFKAASWADCIGRENQTAFWKFLNSVFDAQDQITAANADEKLRDAATAAGANAQTAAACSAEPATKARVEQSIQLGKEAGVTGTPTLFLNGRKIADVNGTPYEILNSIAKFQATNGK